MALPQLFLQSLEGLPGFDRQAFEEVHAAGAQVTSIRMNSAKWKDPDIRKLTEDYRENQGKKISATGIPWCKNGYYLDQRPSFTFDPLFHAGAYYVQEASSMFIGYALAQVCAGQNSLKALDLCAAPGGKTTLLASMDQVSLLVSNEIIRTRLPVLFENVVKWGAPHVFISQQDPRDFQRLPGFFDILLVDAPCSGSGLFRRDPQAINEWSPQSVALCSQRQQRILADSLHTLKEDGILIYSTCSYSMDEDEAILDWLVSECEMESVKIDVPEEWNIVRSESEAKGAFGYRFYPDKIQGEGFFIACLRKKGSGVGSPEKSSKPAFAGIADRQVLREWVKDADDYVFLQKNDDYMAVPVVLQQAYMELSANLSLRKSGTRMGSLIRGKLNPEHELAMSIILADGIPALDVDYETAIRFLRKETFVPETQQQGWILVKYGNLPLGFMKSMPNRANNYYPSDWRIRSASPFNEG